VTVRETFFAIEVKDMQRAAAFYVAALGAAVVYASPGWTSLRIAGVRLALAWNPDHTPCRVGLHFAVDDLRDACAHIEAAGGQLVAAEVEVAPGIIVADVSDTEDNTFSLTQAT
jgi:predicted enzyme related to lactoylglutathione lyase